MRYACLVYLDPATAFDGSPEHNAILDEAGPSSRELTARGIVNEAMAMPAEAVTIRIRNGKMRRTDGPFMETKEMLAGFVVIDAADMDAAIAMATTNPMARLGAVEIRPLLDLSTPRPKL